MKTETITITGYYQYGKIVRYVDCDGFRNKEFYTLKSLIDYYNLNDVKRTSKKEFCIGDRGGVKEWPIYTATLKIN